MACQHCEGERAEARDFCSHCFEIFQRPGRLTRLLRRLGFPRSRPSRENHVVHVETREEFRLQDGSGQERVYQSLDEMPPEIRSLFEKARSGRS